MTFENITLPMETNSTSLAGWNTMIKIFVSLQQLVFFFACMENGFIIYVILRYIKHRDISNVFILNLSIADFCAGISTGGQIFYFLYPELNKSVETCMLRFQIVGAMSLSSQMTVFLLSVDRFLAICHQAFYDKIMKNNISAVAALLPWVYSFSISSAPFFGWNQWALYPRCTYSLLFPSGFYWTTSLTVTLLSFLSFLAHTLMYNAIRRFYLRVNPLDEMHNDDARLHKSIKGAKVMAIVTIAFTICWLPYMAFSFSYAIGYQEERSLNNISIWLPFIGITNSVINPIIYAWYKTDIRKASKKACACLYVMQNT